MRWRVSAETARSPGQAAARAADARDATHTADDSDTTTAATTAAAAATTATGATTATATAMTATAAATAGELHAAADVLLVEEMERGEADVRHFLFAEDEASLIGRIVVGLRNSGRRHRRCGCATEQRKTQSRGTQYACCGGFALAFLRRSLLDP